MSSDEVTYEIIPKEKTDEGILYLVKFKGPKIGWYDDIYFVVENETGTQEFRIKHKENDDDYVYFESEVFLKKRSNYRYYFAYDFQGEHKYFKKKHINDNGISSEEMFKMPVGFSVPDWAQGATIYHIFVDRFNRGSKDDLEPMPRRTIHKSWDEDITHYGHNDKIWNNDYYGGDLKGITDKLDYIKDLGTDILYLSPIVYSQSNHGYDTSDYESIDPYKGSKEDLRVLCEEAHKRGMRVILDSVFNHIGSDSRYFNKEGSFSEEGVCQNVNSKYAPFFKKKFNESTGKYEFFTWWGIPTLIECNCDSKEWIDYITGKGGVIDQWFDLGIDGLRIDVADDYNLTDNFLAHVYDAVIRNKEDGYIVGECWDNIVKSGKDCMGNGHGLHSFMNYMLMDALIRYIKYEDSEKMERILNEENVDFSDETINSAMNSTSTHDISRAITMFAPSDEFSIYNKWIWTPVNEKDFEYCYNYTLTPEQYERSKELLKTYVSTLAFLPGNFTIFAGDEVGEQGLGNLANRRAYPWGKEDKDMLEFFTHVGKIRASKQFLRKAKTEVYRLDKDCFMFERKDIDSDRGILYAVNVTDKDVLIDVPDEYEDAPAVYTLKKSNSRKLAPRGAIALEKQ